MSFEADSAFPRFLPPEAAIVRDLFHQLRRFEALPPARQQAIQLRQLNRLFRHAQAHSSFWRARIEAAGLAGRALPDLAALSRLPPLTRQDLQENFEALRARPPDMAETQVERRQSSGSTGRPVAVERATSIYGALYRTTSLVDHVWHGRDARKTLGVLRRQVPDTDHARRAPPFSWFGPVGQTFTRTVLGRPVEELYEAVARHRPAYLLAPVPVLRILCEIALTRPNPPRIEQLLSFGSLVTDDLRSLARQAFGARVVDRYSCEEAGWIALQCPKHDHYHVTGGTMLAEIVDEAGAPCPPGVPGRVLLTSLHSYAMPLIRYDVGDIAIPGPPCDCGIALPVIARVQGRMRDSITLPDGTRRYVDLEFAGKPGAEPILDYQVRHYACGTTEILFRCARPLTAEEREALTASVHTGMGHPFPVVLREVARVARLESEKWRNFVAIPHRYGETPAG